MKNKWLLTLLFAGQALAQNSADSHSIEAENIGKTLDVLIAAYRGAHNELSAQNGDNTLPFSPQEMQRARDETVLAIDTLQRLGRQLQQGELPQAADSLDQLQEQLQRFAGDDATLSRGAHYLRHGARAYRRWQSLNPRTPLQEADSRQIREFVRLMQEELGQGEGGEREIGKMLGTLSAVLNLFEVIADSERQGTVQEIDQFADELRRLRGMAEEQGVRSGQQIQGEILLQNLKLRAAEHQIGKPSLREDAQLQLMLDGILARPQPLFSAAEYDTALRLLEQLGADFAGHKQTMERQKARLIR